MSPLVALTEPAAEAAISAAAWALHLPTVRAEATRLADDAARAGLTHRGFLAEVLSAEVDDRDARRRQRRVIEARFPRTKRLADFDLGAAPSGGAAPRSAGLRQRRRPHHRRCRAPHRRAWRLGSLP